MAKATIRVDEWLAEIGAAEASNELPGGQTTKEIQGAVGHGRDWVYRLLQRADKSGRLVKGERLAYRSNGQPYKVPVYLISAAEAPA